MASIFTTMDNMKTKTNFGGSVNTPIYLQFVPGVCADSVTSVEQLNSYGQNDNVNSILAIPHIRKGVKKKRTSLTDQDRYFPLLRGIVDVPTKGDPVLLCTIGGIQYYLGPLNTQNEVNFNEDNLREPDLNLNSKESNRETKTIKARGESLNFIRNTYHRMSKKWNPKLDLSKSYNETHGDMMLEGRHGNSIRIGSRSENPYVFISNGRQPQFQREGFSDGSLIAITNKGSLNQHFGGYAKALANSSSPPEEQSNAELEVVNGFILSSDYISPNEEPPNRLMSKLVSSVNGDTNANDLIYKYGSEEDENQILFLSDRIVMNSKSDDIYLSSNKDIHIGTKRHLTVSTSENFIVESEKTYLGDPNKKEMDNMVLGKKLQEVLKGIVNIFNKIQITTQLGPQKILPVTEPDIQQVLSDINTIISNKHFIEE